MPVMIRADGPSPPVVPPGKLEVRQARLKPEYSILYPTLQPGVWERAVTVADRLLADGVLHGRVTALRGRMLIDAHFEFRGGRSRGGERIGIRSRKDT